jgi:hypothetical protein
MLRIPKRKRRLIEDVGALRLLRLEKAHCKAPWQMAEAALKKPMEESNRKHLRS